VRALLEHLHSLGQANVLVEGGPHVMGAFIAGQEIDEVHIFMAPKLIPGSALRPVFGRPPRSLVAAPNLLIESVTDSGGDVYVVARWKRRGPFDGAEGAA